MYAVFCPSIQRHAATEMWPDGVRALLMIACTYITMDSICINVVSRSASPIVATSCGWEATSS